MIDRATAELVEWDWVYGPEDDHERLHYLTEHVWPEGETWGPGTTSCGLIGSDWAIPGFLSRMGSERCDACCDVEGYPRGKGSPKNDEACRLLVEARLPKVLHEGVL